MTEIVGRVERERKGRVERERKYSEEEGEEEER